MYSYSQVPFGIVVERTCEQLKLIAKGDYEAPATGGAIGSIAFVGVSLPVSEIIDLLYNVSDYQNKKLFKCLLEYSHPGPCLICKYVLVEFLVVTGRYDLWL